MWPLYCAFLHPTLPKNEAMVIYIYIYAKLQLVLGEKGFTLHRVYAISTATWGEDENSQITARVLIYEEAKDLYSGQVWSTAGYPGSTYNYDRNGFWPAQCWKMKRYRNLCIRLYEHVYCTMHVSWLYFVIQVKDECTTVWEENTLAEHGKPCVHDCKRFPRERPKHAVE